MPLILSKDAKGSFYQWGSHGHRYHFKTSRGQKTAKTRAMNQARAIERSKSIRGGRKKHYRRQTGRKVYRRKRGRGVLDNIFDTGKIFGYTIPEMHLRGFSGKYNFAGPFTKLHERIDDYGRPITKPINRLDEIAMQHDLDYQHGVPKAEADKKMLDAISSSKAKDWREYLDMGLVKGIIGAKYKLGLGKKRRKKRK